MAQALYRDDHGTFATSLEQLTNEFVHPRRGYTFCLEGDGNQWSITVPHQPALPGSYLLTGAGKLYFSQSTTATTNDVLLRDLRR